MSSNNFVSWADDITEEDFKSNKYVKNEDVAFLVNDEDNEAIWKLIEENNLPDECYIAFAREIAKKRNEKARNPSAWYTRKEIFESQKYVEVDKTPVTWSKIVKVGLPDPVEDDATEATEALSATENFECSDCTQSFFFSTCQQDTFKERGWTIPKRCVNCNILKKASDIDIICKSCGNTFCFTKKQQDDFKSKGYETPKVCKGCRRVKKAGKA